LERAGEPRVTFLATDDSSIGIFARNVNFDSRSLAAAPRRRRLGAPQGRSRRPAPRTLLPKRDRSGTKCRLLL